MGLRLQQLSKIVNPLSFRFAVLRDTLKCGVPAHVADYSEKGVVLFLRAQARFRQYRQGGFHPRKLAWTHEAMAS